jgi:hypothetical protein
MLRIILIFYVEKEQQMAAVIELICLLAGAVIIYENEKRFNVMADLVGCGLLLAGVTIVLWQFLKP